MNLNSMNDMMDLLSLVCGAYCLYTWLRLLVQKSLFANSLLVPKDAKPEDCLDEEAYIHYIRPRLGILSVTLLAFTLFSAVNLRLETPVLDFPWTFILWAAEFGVLVWFAVCSSKALREYF